MQGGFYRISGLVLVLSGCNISFSLPDDTQVACDSTDECPLGLICDERIGRCVLTPDREPPQLLSATSTSESAVDVVFSEAVEAATVTVDSFNVTPALNVLTVISLDATTWRLATARQIGGRTYDLSVSGVADSSENIVDTDTVAFVGFGTAPDTVPPTPLLPADGAIVRQDATTLIAWTAVNGANGYTLEIATTSDFSAPVGAPVVVTPPDASYEFSPPSEGTFYWRVVADVTDAGTEPPENEFDVVADAIKVFCGAGVNCDDDPARPEAGNAARPYRDLSRGIVAAEKLGFSSVHMASRGSGETYLTSLVLVGSSISIFGGYDATFSSATRDPIANPTILASSSAAGAITYLNVTAPTELNGVTLRGTGQDGTSLEVGANSTGVTVRNCHFDSVGGTGILRGIFASDIQTAGFRVEDSSFAVGSAGAFGIAIWGDKASIAVADCSFTGGSDVGNAAAFTQNLEEGSVIDLLVERSTVDFTGPGQSLGVQVRGGRSVTVRDSTFVVMGDASPASQNSVGVSAEDVAAVSVTESKFFVGGGQADNRILDASFATTSVTFANNIGELFAVTGATNTAVELSTPGLFDLPPVVPPALVAHNTLVLRGPGAWGVSAGANEASVINNLFVCSVGDPHVGIRVDDVNPNAELKTVRNNGFKDCATLYIDQPGTSYTTMLELNGLDGTSGSACDTSRFSGNFEISQAPTDVFTDPDGASNDVSVDDNDFSLLLATDPDSIATGGLDTSLVDCGPCAMLYGCGDFQSDFAGAARTSTPALGALEKP